MKYSISRISVGSCQRVILHLLNPLLLLALIFSLVYKVTGYQDSETLIQAARAIFSTVNPYDSDFFLNGYILAIPFQLYSQMFSVAIGARIYALFNLFLIAIVIWDMLGRSNLKKLSAVVICVFASSPTRAMVASVQHTGLIIGLTYISYKLATSDNGEIWAKSYKKIFVSSFLIVIPLELKPQLVVPLLGLYLFNRNLRPCAVATLSIIFFSHLAFSSYFHMPFDKFWLERLMARSSETTVSGTRENSPWSLFGSLFGHSRVWIGLSSLVFISLVVYFWLNFTKTKVGNQQYILALIIPLVLAYIHPYDLVLSSIIVAISFISGTRRTGATVLLFLFLLPTLSTNLSSVFAAFSIYFVCWLGATSRTNYWRKDLLELISASIIYTSVVIVTEDVGLRVNLHMTILIVGSLLFIFAELLRTPAQKRLNGI